MAYPEEPVKEMGQPEAVAATVVQATVIGQPGQQQMATPASGGGPDVFNNLSSIFVAQEFAAIELCGIEAKNRYRIHPSEGQPSFLYVMETSQCCERIFCAPCRALTMNVFQGNDQHQPVVLSMTKKSHVPMLPCPMLINPVFWPWGCLATQCTPEFVVSIPGGVIIGSIYDPPGPLFGCKINSIIRDGSGKEVYRTGPACMCTAGLIFPCVADMAIGVFKGDKEVARVTRIALDCIQMCCTKTNNMRIDFNLVTDPTEKKLIFAAAMLLDLQYFEQKK